MQRDSKDKVEVKQMSQKGIIGKFVHQTHTRRRCLVLPDVWKRYIHLNSFSVLSVKLNTRLFGTNPHEAKTRLRLWKWEKPGERERERLV